VFINTASDYDGSDTGARPDEAVSWGKIKLDASPVKLYGDATILFPLIVSQTFVPYLARGCTPDPAPKAAAEARAAAARAIASVDAPRAADAAGAHAKELAAAKAAHAAEVAQLKEALAKAAAGGGGGGGGP